MNCVNICNVPSASRNFIDKNDGYLFVRYSLPSTDHDMFLNLKLKLRTTLWPQEMDEWK